MLKCGLLSFFDKTNTLPRTENANPAKAEVTSALHTFSKNKIVVCIGRAIAFGVCMDESRWMTLTYQLRLWVALAGCLPITDAYFCKNCVLFTAEVTSTIKFNTN